MTVLASKFIRDALNIDTLERGLVYSALLLRASNTLNAPANSEAQNTYTNAVRIITDLIQIDSTTIYPTIQIYGKLPYDNQQALKHGGNFLEYLKVFDDSDPNPFLFNCDPTTLNHLPIPDEPSYLVTLEQYFVWCAQLLLAGLLIKTPIDTQSITFSFLEEDPDGPSVEINAIIPYDLKIFLQNNNLMNATKSLITSLPSQRNATENKIGNLNSLGNVTLISNN